MMMDQDEDDENPHEISLEGMIPEFEPVEITAVQHGGRKTAVYQYGGNDNYDDDMSEVDIDDDDEFNDVEEITDDQEIIEAENIKVEPDINFM